MSVKCEMLFHFFARGPAISDYFACHTSPSFSLHPKDKVLIIIPRKDNSTSSPDSSVAERFVETERSWDRNPVGTLSEHQMTHLRIRMECYPTSNPFYLLQVKNIAEVNMDVWSCPPTETNAEEFLHTDTVPIKPTQ